MSRIFNASNAPGASVYDVDTKQKLGHVMSVDIDAGKVVMAFHPYRTVGNEVSTLYRTYRAIHPIYAGNRSPVLFHCYGWQA